ncbi:hypothetical protein SAMN05216388_102614 [Halorientalis persicus]|uniref:Uncharacterized protein n=1 Tax=Halorientalis persicus TaxID=1367881 RepID=A0A1H8U850_9EURY|nr:hypothetical protein [Halorientalis persicus]SEO99256.1 hypothetical protein SAMN05216388_102614 [Halorientalis persicus]
MASSQISLPIGGINDQCGLCGTPLFETDDVGLFGLNGLTCVDCYLNFARYSPSWGSIKLENGQNLGVHTVAGHPQSPYYDGDSVGIVILDPEWTYEHTPDHTASIFSGLTQNEREFVYRLAADTWSDDIATIPVPEDAWEAIRDFHHRGDNTLSPYLTARESLVPPFAVTPNRIYATEIRGDNDQDAIVSRLKSCGKNNDNTTTNSSLSEFEVESSTTTENSTDETEKQESTDKQRTGQSNLGSFG